MCFFKHVMVKLYDLRPKTLHSGDGINIFVGLVKALIVVGLGPLNWISMEINKMLTLIIMMFRYAIWHEPLLITFHSHQFSINETKTKNI